MIILYTQQNDSERAQLSWHRTRHNRNIHNVQRLSSNLSFSPILSDLSHPVSSVCKHSNTGLDFLPLCILCVYLCMANSAFWPIITTHLIYVALRLANNDGGSNWKTFTADTTCAQTDDRCNFRKFCPWGKMRKIINYFRLFPSFLTRFRVHTLRDLWEGKGPRRRAFGSSQKVGGSDRRAWIRLGLASESLCIEVICPSGKEPQHSSDRRNSTWKAPAVYFSKSKKALGFFWIDIFECLVVTVMSVKPFDVYEWREFSCASSSWNTISCLLAM